MERTLLSVAFAVADVERTPPSVAFDVVVAFDLAVIWTLLPQPESSPLRVPHFSRTLREVGILDADSE